MIDPAAGAVEATGRRLEVDRRLEAVREILDRRGLTACLLRARRNIAWLTAGASAHVLQSTEEAVAGILVTRDEAVAITPNIEAARLADEELGGTGIPTVAVPWWESGAIEAEAARRSAGAQPARDERLEPDLVPVRSVLSPFDQDRLASLGRIARDAVDGALASVEAGSTEEDLAAELLARLPGVRAPVVLVAADERLARYRHPLPGPTPIRRRVMLVLVAEEGGLHVAVTRIRELEPPGPELRRRLEAVIAIQQAMDRASVEPGATLGGVIAAARSAYAAAGDSEEWRQHHQGGSIGYQARERIAFPGDPTPIVPGMALAWNPSIAGAKVEETAIVGAGGMRIVTAR